MPAAAGSHLERCTAAHAVVLGQFLSVEVSAGDLNGGMLRFRSVKTCCHSGEVAGRPPARSSLSGVVRGRPGRRGTHPARSHQQPRATSACPGPPTHETGAWQERGSVPGYARSGSTQWLVWRTSSTREVRSVPGGGGRCRRHGGFDGRPARAVTVDLPVRWPAAVPWAPSSTWCCAWRTPALERSRLRVRAWVGGRGVRGPL